jgi:nucleotidyltransferase/DNA polymerase involved in DNA repair
VAIQQHQDVIAVNYPARQAGVKKHMPPAQV